MRSVLLCTGLFGLAALASDSTVYLIRHGEKPSNGSTGLSPKGQQRAQCLRKVFGSASSYHIGKIFAEQPQSDGTQARPFLTVQPLAQDLGLTVDTSCTKTDDKCVQSAVDAYNGSGNILICWEHSELTDIVKQLGDNSAPEYPDNSYNLIWTDPYPYDTISSITSENCPGLDS